MRTAVIAILLATGAVEASTAAPKPKPDSEAFGLASGQDATACVATLRKIERFPMTVTIVVPGPAMERSSVRGRIEARLPAACKPLEHANIGSGERALRFYSLRLDHAPAEEYGWTGVADFENAGAARLRSCNSMESMHFTAWSGRPLRSVRLWHGSVPFGYEVDSSGCKDREVE